VLPFPNAACLKIVLALLVIKMQHQSGSGELNYYKVLQFPPVPDRYKTAQLMHSNEKK
jgi:hypothetical protein